MGGLTKIEASAGQKVACGLKIKRHNQPNCFPKPFLSFLTMSASTTFKTEFLASLKKLLTALQAISEGDDNEFSEDFTFTDELTEDNLKYLKKHLGLVKKACEQNAYEAGFYMDKKTFTFWVNPPEPDIEPAVECVENLLEDLAEEDDE